jgi:hypothetical protein
MFAGMKQISEVEKTAVKRSKPLPLTLHGACSPVL